MKYFLYLRRSKRDGGGRVWIVDANLKLNNCALCAGAFNDAEANQISKAIRLAEVYKLPCDNTLFLTPAMRQSLNL